MDANPLPQPEPFRYLAPAGYTLHGHQLRLPDAAADQRPWLVFLHDSLGCTTLWRDFPARLAAATGCHALVYDRRGYGQSSAFGPAPRTTEYLAEEAPVLRQLLDHVGIAQAILFGHSDGGSIALLAAARYPGRVAGLITEGAHVFVEDVTLAGIRAAQQQYHTTDLPQRLARYHGAGTAAVFSAWADTWLHPGFRAWNIEASLAAIRCPVLVLQGAADEYGTPAQVQAIAQQVSGPAQAVLLPGIGHTPHKEAPAETLRLSTDFVRNLIGS